MKYVNITHLDLQSLRNRRDHKLHIKSSLTSESKSLTYIQKDYIKLYISTLVYQCNGIKIGNRKYHINILLRILQIDTTMINKLTSFYKREATIQKKIYRNI